MKLKHIEAEELDRMFDDGEDISEFIDWDTMRWPNLEQRRVNVDLPEWMIGELDKEAKRCGVTRQSIIKMWLAAKLDSMS
jgi:hypothetical protein